ncbi:uncharacterized protein LOC110976563 [Acanthaster planci]|uniref:Uncharacterized protein LOC110976563 n=1 Tax=Acanthaster planci TaxID=133434 RepID=A0A8B7XXL6_ACAPL|nr:uncharacterized protein LOC110976563 [Acanthaster planci]
MAESDSLEAIDRDLKEVVDYCESAGLDSEQVAADAKLLLSAAQKHEDSSSFQTLTKKVLFVTVAVTLVAFLLQNAWTFRWLSVAGKTFQMKILPYWDWTNLYHEECIVANPYMVVEKLTEEDCEVCETYDELDVVHNISIKEITEDYLFDNIPFIVTDATQNWKAFKEFNFDSFKNLYTTNEVLRSHDVCEYKESNSQRLAEILRCSDCPFHAMWLNCKLPAIKVFRSFYYRPYFLPPMVESALENFVAFSSGRSESSEEFLIYYTSDDLTWFAQIRGTYLIQLRPKAPCEELCETLEINLQEGQTIVLTNEMWELWFAPSNESPAIAFGSTGRWDS